MIPVTQIIGPPTAWLSALRSWLLLLCMGVVLAGCTAQLAPSYDPSIADGVQSLNQQAMSLYATVAQGVDKSTYSQRQGTYTALIAQTNALSNLAKSRPDPDSLPKFLESKLKDWTKLQNLAAPTGDILDKISVQFTTMQQSDQSGGISSLEAQAFQGQFNIDIQQALTYENALKRGQP